MPRTNAVERIQRDAQLGVLCLLVVIFAVVGMAERSGPGLINPVYGMLGMLVGVFGLLTLPSLFVRWGKARLNARGWRGCEWCGYDTKLMGESGRCPECGQHFSSDFLRKDFENFERHSLITIAFQPVLFFKGDPRAAGTEAVREVPRTGPRDYVERAFRRSLHVQFAAMAAAWLLLGLSERSLLQGLSSSRLIDCLYIGVLVRLGYFIYRRMRLSRRNWNICRWCEFDTRDVGTKGTCPKCGGEFSAIDLRADFDGMTLSSAVIYGFLSDVSIPHADGRDNANHAPSMHAKACE